MNIKLLLIVVVALIAWTRANPNGCASVYNASMIDRRAEIQYCAGNFMQVNQPANSRLALDQSNGYLYYGYIGGLQVVNSDNFKLKQVYNFSSIARFQSVDLLRNYAWLVTAQGVASIDLENPTSDMAYSSLQVQGNQNCPGDFTVLDELGGNAYSICVNGSSVALALKIDISDRKASVKTYFPIGQLQFQQNAKIISLSPDRRRSILYTVTLAYDNTPLMINAIRTADMSYANSTNVQGLGIYAVIGCDDHYFYTLDNMNNTHLIVAKRDIYTMRVVARALDRIRIDLLKSYSIDVPAGQLTVWHDSTFILYDFNLKNLFGCQRLPIPTHPCNAWRVIGNSMLWKQNNFLSLQCMDDNTLFVSRSLLSPNDGCPNHCSSHGQCVADQCYCAKGYEGVDCSKGGNSICGRECGQDSDCWGEFLNACVVCYKTNQETKKTCRPVCTAPCSYANQCYQWGTHSYINPCAQCSKQFHYCLAMPHTCGTQGCLHDEDCTFECPTCVGATKFSRGMCK
eukprot:TRINITY_DN1923_c0_g1_i4.p1 TRINITY_DN1923_c0_g1~~TRINITY_DN1923_c0_g1_i4.p1  ORF type:complete len:513 (-),score=46.59 TRINITY_DN1923_c0_g1_i4:25-1563(-)